MALPGVTIEINAPRTLAPALAALRRVVINLIVCRGFLSLWHRHTAPTSFALRFWIWKFHANFSESWFPGKKIDNGYWWERKVVKNFVKFRNIIVKAVLGACAPCTTKRGGTIGAAPDVIPEPGVLLPAPYFRQNKYIAVLSDRFQERVGQDHAVDGDGHGGFNFRP